MFLCPRSHSVPYVLTCIALVQESTKRGVKRAREQGDRPEAWRRQIQEWRSKSGFRAGSQHFDKVGKPIAGLERPTDRERAILNFLVALEQLKRNNVEKRSPSAQEIRHALSCTVVDLSQNPDRRCFTSRMQVNHALTTSTRAVHLGEWRVIVPRELLYLQGHPRTTQIPLEMKQRSVQTLAGEGIALPCLGVCIWSQFLLKGFPSH